MTDSTPQKRSRNAPLAAVDLGSNSFHMVIGRVIGDQVSLLDRLREPVRLAGGLRDDGSLDPETEDRAIACLERFAERLREVPRSRTRVVGTNTFRLARDSRSLVARVGRTLRVPIEILPGPEEARLIYLGVAHDVALGQGPRLVVDIGGGSTELAVGEGFEPSTMDSLHMGCVSWTLRHFPDGRITREAYRGAELAARVELETLEDRYRDAGWVECIGSSGTANAIREIVRQNGWSAGRITRPALKKLRKATIEAGSTDGLALPGLQRDRAPVIPGGIAIVMALFDALEIETMRTSEYALREGILYDLLGRIEHHDVREQTVRWLVERYHVDVAQAARVQRTALGLFEAVAESWNLDRDRGARWLRWSAQLYEIGLVIAYSGYHKHGAYLIGNSSLPGFSREARSMLATLVRAHRRKPPLDLFDDLSPYYRDLAFRLCVLLRIAVCLNRRRGATQLPRIQVRASEDGLELRFPTGWLENQPLTSADLEAEASALSAAGLSLATT